MQKKYVLLLLTGFIFGSQFLFTKYALLGYAPSCIAMIRLWVGALTLTLVIHLNKKNTHIPKGVHWYHYALIGFLEAALPSFLIPWGQQYIDTSLSSILICTVPLFTMFLGPILIRSNRINFTDTLSILIGFIGVIILINFNHTRTLINHNLLPELSVLSASLCWALSIISIKKLPPVPPILFTRNMLIAACIETTLMWLITTPHIHIPFHVIPLINIIILGIFSSGFVFVFYVSLIKLGGINFASFSNYLVPVVGIGLGVTLLNESIQRHEIIGTIIIISALLIQSLRDYIVVHKKKINSE